MPVQMRSQSSERWKLGRHWKETLERVKETSRQRKSRHKGNLFSIIQTLMFKSNNNFLFSQKNEGNHSNTKGDHEMAIVCKKIGRSAINFYLLYVGFSIQELSTKGLGEALCKF